MSGTFFGPGTASVHGGDWFGNHKRTGMMDIRELSPEELRDAKAGAWDKVHATCRSLGFVGMELSREGESLMDALCRWLQFTLPSEHGITEEEIIARATHYAESVRGEHVAEAFRDGAKWALMAILKGGRDG